MSYHDLPLGSSETNPTEARWLASGYQGHEESEHPGKSDQASGQQIPPAMTDGLQP